LWSAAALPISSAPSLKIKLFTKKILLQEA
jgi:hypothetical protein